MAWPTTVTPVEDVPAVRRAFGPDATNTPVFQPVRRFTGVGDEEIECLPGALDAFAVGGYWIALVIRINAQTLDPQEVYTIIELEDGGQSYTLGIEGDGRWHEGTSLGGGYISQYFVDLEDIVDHWLFVAHTNDGWFVHDLTTDEELAGGLRSGTDGGDLIGLGLDTAVRFGSEVGSGGDTHHGTLNFDIAAAGVWLENWDTPNTHGLLISSETLRGWLEISPAPVALWLFEQIGITSRLLDISGGGAHQTSRVGTEVLGEAPPIPYGGVEPVVEKEIIDASTKPPTVGQLVPRGM